MRRPRSFGLGSARHHASLVQHQSLILFGGSGLADEGLAEPDDAEGPAVQGDETLKAKPAFLEPFKPKADADYVASIAPRLEKRTRRHETLVNTFVQWGEARGWQIRRNQAIDIAVGEPPVIIEAKIVPLKRAELPIRDGIGQLYEYRYFQIVRPKTKLVLLASRPPSKEWMKYLETDRGIGLAWPTAKGFQFSPLAKAALDI